jgi:hypothetical protein
MKNITLLKSGPNLQKLSVITLAPWHLVPVLCDHGLRTSGSRQAGETAKSRSGHGTNFIKFCGAKGRRGANLIKFCDQSFFGERIRTWNKFY